MSETLKRLKNKPILYVVFVVGCLFLSVIFGEIFGFWLAGLIYLPRRSLLFALAIYGAAVLADFPFFIRMIAERKYKFVLARLAVIYFITMPIGSLILLLVFRADNTGIDGIILDYCTYVGILIAVFSTLLALFGCHTLFYKSLENLYRQVMAAGILWK